MTIISNRLCPRCREKYVPHAKHEQLCAACYWKQDQVFLQTDLLSGATQDPAGKPKLPPKRRTLQDRFDDVVDAFQCQGIRSGRLSALDHQLSTVRSFARCDGDRLIYRGFEVVIVTDESDR